MAAASNSFCPARTMDISLRLHCSRRGPRLNLVGPRPAYHPECGPSVAALYFLVLCNLESTASVRKTALERGPLFQWKLATQYRFRFAQHHPQLRDRVLLIGRDC